MQQAALLECPGFDLLSSFEDGFGPAEVDVGGSEVSVSSPLLGGSDEPETLRYKIKSNVPRVLTANNRFRRLKTLSDRTPYEYICKIWTSEPERFIVNLIHQMPGLNN